MKTVIFYSLLSVFAYFLIMVLFWAFVEVIPAWNRKRKVNRRIVRQAKAAGVWGDIDKMGGKALELYAWKHWAIYREEGETDAHLRLRIYSKRKGQF